MIKQGDFAGAVGFSYARFSDPSQGAGHSIERQEEYAPRFCLENGLEFNEEISFRDEGRSAFKGAHLCGKGELARFLQFVEAGYVKPGDVLIVENLDRMSRLPLFEAEKLLQSILSRGVRIHTRSPYAVYDKRTLNNPMERMQMIFEFSRSHRESRAKQERLSRRWERNRSRIRSGEYHLAKTPAWLKAKRDGSRVVGYEVIPERARAIRLIFKLCNEGHGLTAICERLNSSDIPPMGRAKHWGRSSVSKILNNRAVIGEYQPHTSVAFDDDEKEYQNTKRVATGDPIPNHFPQIVDGEFFDRAAVAMASRRNHRTGAGTKRVTNLFAGLFVDVRDGGPMHVVDKGDGPRLMSTYAQSKVKGSTCLSIPYEVVEQAFLTFIDQLPLAMVLPQQAKKTERQLERLSKDVESLELQIGKLKAKTREKQSDALLDLIVERDTELKSKQAEIEKLERGRASSAGMAAKSSKAILGQFAAAKPAGLLELRTRLRAELRHWIKSIAVLTLDISGNRAALVDVELQNGKRLQFRASQELITYPPELADVDIRAYSKWPKRLRKSQWDTEQPATQKLRELDDSGLPVAEIGRQLGMAASKVSERLIQMGRRRQQRRTKDSGQDMTWHAQGNGWCRTLKGKRYFVGMGTLKKLYPRLVKTPDKDGSLKAANRWWKEHSPPG